MKKRTVLITLVLTLALVFSSLTSVFAAVPAKTKEAIAANRTPVLNNGEVSEELIGAVASDLSDQVAAGKYKLISTKDLEKLVSSKKAVVIDTMPDAWWTQRHIPGAINQVVGEEGPAWIITKAQQKALYEKVKKAVGTKKVTKYKNKKTKKVITAAKYKKLSKKNKKNYKKVTVKEVNKDATIVVYCGFTKCQRSHQAAMYLTKLGFKNVKRYAGGICAWVDAGNDIEGTDLTAAE